MARGASVVVDLAFGDSGKGTLVDWLVRARDASLVVRWNGGAQAGHNVVLDDGRHHTFSQLGAGTFVRGVRTHLAEGFVLHPTALLVEARYLADDGVVDALSRLSIAESARVITPFHQAANRLRELARGDARHGTCGVGFGEAVRDALSHPEDSLRAGDLAGDRGALSAKLARVRERVRASLGEALVARCSPKSAARELALWSDASLSDRWIDALAPMRGLVVRDDALGAMWADRSVVLEGAQGVLLDEHVGFHPHTTWSTCSSDGAMAMLAAHGWDAPVDRIGVLRSYLTRHGEGPLPTHDEELDALDEPHNASDGWQGRFRRGWPDLVLARYALAACEVERLAITHLDRLAERPRWKAARAYRMRERDEAMREVLTLERGDLAHQERLTAALGRAEPIYVDVPSEPDAFVGWIESELGKPVTITSHGPTAGDKRERARA